MNHADVKSHMADYIEGDLAISKRALFDAHLDRCAECSDEIEEMRSTISLLRALPDPEPPATLAADVMRRIRQGEAEPGLFDRVATWLDELTTPRVMVPVAAFAAGMAVVLLTGQVEMSLPGLQPQAPAQLAAAVPEPAPSAVAAPAETPVAAPTQLAEARLARRPSLQPRLVPNRLAVREFPLMTMPTTSPRTPGLAGGGQPDANFVMLDNGGARGIEPIESSSEDREARRLQALDGRLDDILRNPEGFAREFAAYDAVEQELWMRILARRAEERGDASEVLLSLQASEEASVLANAFGQAVGEVATGAE